MDGLGMGTGLSTSRCGYRSVRGIGFGFSSITKALRKASRLATAPIRAAKVVLKKIPGGKYIVSAEEAALRAAGKGATFLGKKAAQYASPAMAVLAGAAAAAGCTAVGIPGPICALPAAKLGAAAGAALSKKLGVSVKSFPVDPAALVRGDPGALMTLGKGLAAKAGIPVTPREAIFLASRKVGLPPEVTAAARFAARKAGVK